MTEVAEKPKKAEAPKKYRVKIHSGTDAADKGDVFLAHNYRGILIKRDTEVEIEEPYVNALKASLITTFVKDNDEQRAVTVPRFSYELNPL